jgi:hypothetical protein
MQFSCHILKFIFKCSAILLNKNRIGGNKTLHFKAKLEELISQNKANIFFEAKGSLL